MSFDEQLTDIIKKDRNIRDSSLNAYIRNIKKLLKIADLEPTIENMKTLFNDKDKVIELLQGKQPSTIRNYIASIIVAGGEGYSELLELYQKQNLERVGNGKKTEAMEKNWTSLDELRDVLQGYISQIDFKKKTLTKKEMDLLKKYVVGSLYIGDDANPPLRLDYIMEIISKPDYNRLTEKEKREKNYLVVQSKMKKFFSLGEYKTSDKYGIKEIPVGKDLNKVLNTWLKYNTSKYLLPNNKGEQITSNALTKLIQSTFAPTGKKISASMLRHIFITEKFPPMTKEKEQIADKMLHSKSQQGDYAKD